MKMRINLSLIAVVLMLLLPGCGKKSESAKKSKNKNKKVALNLENENKTIILNDEATLLTSAEKINEIPVLKEEIEDFFEDDSISEFAFIDNEEFSEKEADENVAINEDSFFEEEDVDDNLVYWEEEETINKEEDKPKFETVFFDLNKNNVKENQHDILTKNIESAKEAVKDGKKIIVNGHCCQLGAPSYNIPLSERRAKAIKQEMIKKGIPEENIKTIGWGQEMPEVFSESSDNQSKIKELAPNRRAEITIS